jgi:DNA ligase-1
MRLDAVVAVSRAVAGTAGRLEKVGHLADLLRRVPPDEVAIVIAFLSGEPRQGRMKIGGAVLAGARGVPPVDAPGLELAAVDRLFDRIAGISGAGSSSFRLQLLRGLMGAATAGEQDFLFRLLFGELRQGALGDREREGALADARAVELDVVPHHLLERPGG